MRRLSQIALQRLISIHIEPEAFVTACEVLCFDDNEIEHEIMTSKTDSLVQLMSIANCIQQMNKDKGNGN